MELFFLGTGAGMPSKLRNVSSIALSLPQRKNATWLFDCGEGTQHQVLHSQIRMSKFEKIFITHLHGDHIFGLPGLLSSRSFLGGDCEVTIYGPSGIKEYVETSLKISKSHMRYPLKIIEISQEIIFEDEQFLVEAFLLDHGVDSFGFRINQKDLPGALDIKKLKQFNIPSGPIYKKIKDGEVVTLDDGTVISGKDYVLPQVKGKVIAIAGDTRLCANSYCLAQNADWLVHEATFSKKEEELARKFFHTTNVSVATLAKQANVKNLILTHLSARFTDVHLDEFCDEAKAIFPNTKVAFDHFNVNCLR